MEMPGFYHSNVMSHHTFATLAVLIAVISFFNCSYRRNDNFQPKESIYILLQYLALTFFITTFGLQLCPRSRT